MLEVDQISPVKVPFKCPVCNGHGTVKFGQLTCSGCGGKGYVVVDQRDIYEERQTDANEDHIH